MRWNKRLAPAFWRSVNGKPPTLTVLPPMRYEEFLAALRTTPRTWQFNKGGVIRSGDGDCPLTKVSRRVSGRRYSLDAWSEAAKAMGLSMYIASQIWPAADNRLPHAPQVRHDLLAATGLLADPLDAELATLVASHEQEPAEEPRELVPA